MRWCWWSRDCANSAAASSPTRTRFERSFPYPVAGLLSDRPLGEVLDASRGINGAAQALGVTFPAPFQMLAFLALSVIPSLKITDRGLLDVDRCELVPLAVDELVELQPSRLPTQASAPYA